MNKKNIIISIIVVILLTFVSFSNVVGNNTVKTSQEELIESEFDFEYCKDYLFETLVEISENQEINDIIKSNYKPQRTILPFRSNNFDLKVEHLELLYNFGLKIMDRLGEDKVEELMENIEMEKPEYLDELENIVMGNDELQKRIYTLNEINNKQTIDRYDACWTVLILTIGIFVLATIANFPFVIAIYFFGFIYEEILGIPSFADTKLAGILIAPILILFGIMAFPFIVFIGLFCWNVFVPGPF